MLELRSLLKHYLRFTCMKYNVKFSLRKKASLLIIAVVLLISVVGMLFFSKATNDIIKNLYSGQVSEISKTIAVNLDGDSIRDIRDAVLKIYDSIDPEDRLYIDVSRDTPEYEEYISSYDSITRMRQFAYLQRKLREMQDVNNVDCLYIIWADVNTDDIIYLIDADYQDYYRPGTLDPLYNNYYYDFQSLEEGFKPKLSVSKDYGWLIMAGEPIHDHYGNVVAYAGVEYSIEGIMMLRRKYLLAVGLLMLVFAALSCWAAIRLVDKFVILPINKLSEASIRYYSGGKDTKAGFADLNIHTGDEIEVLADSMAKMEEDIENYIDNLLTTTQELNTTREYAKAVDQMAYKDALTNVRNKRAFLGETVRLNDKLSHDENYHFGAAVIDLNDLKLINDNYGHDKGDVAIQQLSHILCDVFRHSPVFRIGGDEFVVVLEGHDYETVDSLHDEFLSELRGRLDDEKAQPWERATAAIGYVLYDPVIDKEVEDVFRRADMKMYENKLEMKRASGETT